MHGQVATSKRSTFRYEKLAAGCKGCPSSRYLATNLGSNLSFIQLGQTQLFAARRFAM